MFLKDKVERKKRNMDLNAIRLRFFIATLKIEMRK